MSMSVTGYMSNEAIMDWMQTHTDSLYDNMRNSMSGANERADAEQALDQIKATLQNDSGKDAAEVRQMINDAMTKYADIPDVAKVLQPMKDKLDADYKAAQPAADAAAQHYADLARAGKETDPNFIGTMQELKNESTPHVNIDKGDADNWGKQIDDSVQTLSKQDSLQMISIQELNSEINQAKQTASALMDAADKSAEAAINHIA